MKVAVDQYILGLTHMVRTACPTLLEGKLTVLIDCRPGKSGWPNPRGDQMFPVILAVNNLLSSHFPERCSTVILYPLPAILKGLWKGVSRLLDDRARNIIKVLANEWGRKVPLALGTYVSLQNFVEEEDAYETHKGEKGLGEAE